MSELSTSRVAGIVLAAGASERMGRAKALLPWQGATFLEHVAAKVHAVASPVVVVEGAVSVTKVLPAGVMHIVHPGWRDGPLSSLQAGIAGLRAWFEPTAIVVATVDRPHIQLASLCALISAHASDPEAIWQLAYKGRRGHPILYPGALLDDLCALPPTESARTLLRREDLATRRRAVEVNDPAVLENIDDPEAYARLLSGGKPGTG